MILKSLIVAVLSIIIFLLLLAVSQYLIYKKETLFGEFMMLLAFGGGAMLLVIFILLCLLNYFTQWRLRSTYKHKANSVYFFWSLLFTLLPIILFVIVDYSDRGRYFQPKTLKDIITDYIAFFILAIFIIIVNRKIVWNNFRNYDRGSTAG